MDVEIENLILVLLWYLYLKVNKYNYTTYSVCDKIRYGGMTWLM